MLADWQVDGVPIPLHPGDVGWATRLGTGETAAALRTWWRDDRPVAVGLLDGPDVLRLAVAPDHADDETLADDVARALEAGDLGGVRDVEARAAPALAAELRRRGWDDGDAWTSLGLDLAARPASLPPAASDVERVGAGSAAAWSEVLASAFGGRHDDATARQRWERLAGGPASDRLHALLLRDDTGAPVAVVGAWTAGPGRPGLVEPLGVHADHVRRGFGRVATLAAAEVLREEGCSSLTVAAPSANVAAVATYRSAGCRELAVTHDLRRPT